ncbi:MAG: transposase [Candidatus Helarchaeota archaeon]
MIETQWVTRSKKNRTVKYDGEWLSLEALVPRLQGETWKKIPYKARLDDEKTRYQYMIELTVRMHHVGMVKLVIVKKRLHDEKAIFLVSDNLDFSAKEIIQTYSKRWDIEVFYRSAKANLGLGKYRLRKLKGIIKYSYLVFFSAVFLEWSKLMGRVSQYREEASTLGQKAKAFKEKFLEGIIKWAHSFHSKHLNFSLAFQILRNAKL